MSTPQVDPYLFFDGNCAEAMRFYERALGGKLEALMTHADSPMPEAIPPGSRDRIMHARLSLGDRALMASDTMPGEPYGGMKNVFVSLTYPTVADANRVFAALAQGGKVNMPIQKTFWTEAFGMVVDRFGAPWMVSGPMAPAK
jgi:PhnB protein